MQKSNKLMVAGLAAAVMLTVGACSDDDDNNPINTNNGMASVRVIHTSYDAPAVDVSADGAVVISNLAYGEPSGYADLPSGNRAITVTPFNAASPVVISAALTLDKDVDYTVYAVNNLDNIEPIVTVDNRTPVSGKAKVRFVHASPDAPAVDIRLNSGDGPIVFDNKAFKSTTDYAAIDPGSYTFVVTPTGSNAEVVVFDPISVASGMVYTVVAHGTLDNTDPYQFAVRVFIDNNAGNNFADLSAALAAVNVVHASPDAPGVDLLVDGIMANTAALTFPNSTDYLPVGAGDRNVKVNVAGTATTVIDATLNLDPNAAYTVFAIDSVSSIEPLVLSDNLTTPAAGKAHVRFVHLSPNAPAVDITTTSGAVVFGDKAFRGYTDFTPLDAGAYDLQVRAAGTSTIVLSLPTLTLEAGKIYTVYAKGFLGGSGNEALGASVIINDAASVLN